MKLTHAKAILHNSKTFPRRTFVRCTNPYCRAVGVAQFGHVKFGASILKIRADERCPACSDDPFATIRYLMPITRRAYVEAKVRAWLHKKLSDLAYKVRGV